MRAPTFFPPDGPSDADAASAAAAPRGPRGDVLRHRRARRRTWALGLGLAVAAPVAGHALLTRQVRSLEATLSQRAGVPCAIASVEAGLTGALRLRGVSLGDMLSADAVEASMSWRSLLSGALTADEIRVEGPRLSISVDATGESELARVLGRLAAARRWRASASSSSGEAAHRAPRRIVVSEGELRVTLAGAAEVRAAGVELRPQPGGVRATARRVSVSAEAPLAAGGRAALALELSPAAADLALPRVSVLRLLAVGGHGELELGAATLPITALSLARLHPAEPLAAQLTIDDHGVPRSATLRLTTRPLPALELDSPHLPLWPFAAVAPPWLDVAAAHIEGQLALARGAALGLSFRGHLERARVDHPVVAGGPVEVTGDFDGTAQLAGTLPSALSGLRTEAAAGPGFDLMARGRYRLGSALGTIDVIAHRGAALAATAQLSLQPAPCAELLASVPRAMRAPLEGMALYGSLGGAMRISVDTAAPLGEGAEVVTVPEGDCRVTAEPPRADVTSLLAAREQTFPDGSRAVVGPDVGAWTALRSLPAHVDGAFVAAEDARFFAHRGFDIGQIAKSLEIDLREGRLARGGSTISQQLIKNSFLDGKRSFARKLNEAILTWRLETRLDKRAILERYLNIIELGPSIYGLAAAAQHWFGTSPQRLSIRQAAFLAALTPEPTTMSRRIVAAAGLDRASAARVETVLRAMKRQGLIDQAELDAARAAPLAFRAAALAAQ